MGAFPLHSQFGLGTGFDVYDENFKETTLPTDFAISERPAPAVVAAARPWIAGQQGPLVRLGPCLRSARALSPAGAVRLALRGQPRTPAKWPPRTPRSRRSWPTCRAGRIDPTLVIVTGDHGEALGDHGELTHGLFAYESTLHVPFILAQVGGAHARETGSVSDDPVRHIDIVPTVLDAVERPAETTLPGRSLLTPAPEPLAITSYFEALSASLNRGWAPLTGVIVGRDKLVELPIPELYDLATRSSRAAEHVRSNGRSPARAREPDCEICRRPIPPADDRRMRTPARS